MPRISQVLPWLDAHGVALTAALAAIVAAWKAVPAPTRARIELAFPRAAGLARSIAAVAPDLIGFARVLWYQVFLGVARASVQPPAASPQPIAPTVTQTVRDVERGGSGMRGFATVDVLALALAVAACAFSAAMLAGCPLPAPDGCTPRDTRCAPDGVPEVCSSTQRWTRGSPSEPCPSTARCCRARSPYGRELHACVPPSACLPEPAAVLSTPSALAGSQ